MFLARTKKRFETRTNKFLRARRKYISGEIFPGRNGGFILLLRNPIFSLFFVWFWETRSLVQVHSGTPSPRPRTLEFPTLKIDQTKRSVSSDLFSHICPFHSLLDQAVAGRHDHEVWATTSQVSSGKVQILAQNCSPFSPTHC